MNGKKLAKRHEFCRYVWIWCTDYEHPIRDFSNNIPNV